MEAQELTSIQKYLILDESMILLDHKRYRYVDNAVYAVITKKFDIKISYKELYIVFPELNHYNINEVYHDFILRVQQKLRTLDQEIQTYLELLEN